MYHYSPRLLILWVLSVLLASIFALTACGPSPEELASQTAIAQTATAEAWTDTPTPTTTTTPTPTSTATPTATPTPQPQVITGSNVNNLQLISTFGRGSIEAFAWSPDGKQIAVAGSSGLWVYASGNFSDIDNRETSSPQVTVAYSPDGTRIATGGMDGVIHLWEATSGEEVGQLQSPQGILSALTFSPDSAKLASSSYASGTDFYQTVVGTPTATIEIWDITGGEVIQTFQTRVIVVQHLLYTPDGEKLISGGRTGSFDPNFFGASSTGYVEIWDLTAGKATAAWIHSKAILQMAVMSDGQTLVTAGEDDPNIKFWNLTTRTVENLRAYTSTWIASADGVVVSPDGTLMVTTGLGLSGIGNFSGGGMLGWKLPEREPSLQFSGSGEKMTFSLQGDRIAGLTDGGIQIWNTTTGRPTGTLNKHYGVSAIELASDRAYYETGLLAISPDNQVVAGSWRGGVILWSVANGSLASSPGAIWTSYALEYSVDGKQLITGNSSGIRLWDAQGFRLIDEVTVGEGYYMRDVVISSDGAVLAAFWTPNVPTKEKYTLLWDLTGQRDPAQFYFPEGYEVKAVGNKGRVLALNRLPYSTSPIQFFTFTDSWESWEFPYVDINRTDVGLDSADIVTSEFNPDSSQIVTCGLQDATARLWQLGSLEPPTTLKLGDPARYVSSEKRNHPPTNICHDIAYSPDGSLIALALMDRGVVLYDASLSSEIVRLTGPAQTLAVAFSRDGKIVAALSADGLVWIWEVLE